MKNWISVLIFGIFLAGSLALDCKHSRSNIYGGEGGDLGMTSYTCTNASEEYCVFMSGYDKKNSGSSQTFTYRGCYSDLQIMYNYYHESGCPDGGHFQNDDKTVTGDLTCCTNNLCNPASINSIPSFILLFLISVSALFYGFSW